MGEPIRGVGPVCQTSLSTGLSKWELGSRHTDGLLYKGHSEGSPEREVHSNAGLPKKDRNICNKQPNLTSTRTGVTTINKAQIEQKEGHNQDQTRSK